MSARLYWYPEPDGLLVAIDLGRSWSELAEADSSDLSTARSADGQRVITTYGHMRTVRALCEYLTGYDTIRELSILGVHLQRNGVVALAEDDGATWGGFAREAPQRGATAIRVSRLLWSAWSTIDLGAGDVVVVQGASGRWEEAEVSSVSAERVVIASPGLRFDYQDEPWVLVRDRRFWPFLRMQDGALQTPILRSDHRITWALELQLEEPPSRLARAAESEESYRGTTAIGGPAYDGDVDVDVERATTSATITSW